MNKKILVITPRFPIPTSGACEQDRLEGIKQLQRLGFDVQVIGKVFDFQDKSKIGRFSKEQDIPIHLVPYRYRQKRSFLQNVWYYLKRILWLPYWDGALYEYEDKVIKNKMEEVLKEFKPDIVWFDYTFMLPLYPLVRKYNCKIITHSLIFDPKNLLEEDGRIIRNYISYMVKLFTDWRCIRKSDYMFAIAPDEKKMYERLGAKKIEVLPLRSLYNLLGKNSIVHDKEVLNVFFLGSSYSIHHNLQFARFIIEEVAPRVHKKYPGKFNFFMTGGKLPKDLQEKCKGVLNYVGFVEDLDEFLSDMDIALIPSLSGTGMQQKIFEPISRGFPIITSKRGLAEYPFGCGEEILCAVKLEEFIEQLGKVIDVEVRRSLSCKALIKANKLFSRDVSDKKILEAINNVS